ncbi:hypothetical protein, partial [Morganella morganii]|uniref:hypothetical protein n=1 Tax=Morganella morganii TaxID=582 RepID=UPI001952BC30
DELSSIALAMGSVTPELRAVYNELMPEITVFFTEIGQDIELYNRFKTIKNSPEFDTLSPLLE